MHHPPLLLLHPPPPAPIPLHTPEAVEVRRLWGDVGVDPGACEDLLLVS